MYGGTKQIVTYVTLVVSHKGDSAQPSVALPMLVMPFAGHE